jgi:aminoglycoside phosphotransferase (APT) family kinase protein
MEFTPGRVLADHTMPGISPADRGKIFDSMNDVLARIHNVDYRAAGLADFGREGQYIQRQIARWSSQYDLARTEDIEAMEKLKQWLPANIPPGDETRINHGDYRLGNTIVHPTEPRIIAVLDWELATLGHPLSDLAYACMYYHLPAGEGRGGLADVDLRELGIPDENEFIAQYCRHAGRARIENWPFFLAFSCFRMAAITQGVYARGLQGNAADPRALTYGGIAKTFAATGLRLAGRST